MSPLVAIIAVVGLSLVGSLVGVCLVLLVAEKQSIKRGEGGIFK